MPRAATKPAETTTTQEETFAEAVAAVIPDEVAEELERLRKQVAEMQAKEEQAKADTEQAEKVSLAHVPRVKKLCDMLNAQIADREEQKNRTLDDKVRFKLNTEIGRLRATLRWLPEAAKVSAVRHHYGCQISKRLKLEIHPGLTLTDSEPVPDVNFRQYVFTTSNPIQIARIEHHRATVNEPMIELLEVGEVPTDQVLVATHDSHGEFLFWTPRAQAIIARREGRVRQEFP